MRVRYPFLVAKSKSDGSDNISIELDLSLHHLASLGLPHEDIRLLYSFIKSGPQQTDSDGSICVGSGISRDSRTLVYRALVEVAPRVDSKTMTCNGVRKLVLFIRLLKGNATLLLQGEVHEVILETPPQQQEAKSTRS